MSVQGETPVILYEDNHCLVLAKPAPLLTQGPAGVPSLEGQAKAYLKAALRKPGNVYLGVPHRLDRPVSGVVLFARNSKAAARLAEQFRDRRVTKVYWGLVAGTNLPGEGVWEDWLRKHPDEARAEIAEPGVEGAKQARLRYCIRQTFASNTLVEFQPETGRMHQIRLQAASRGWPLWGDTLYGSTQSFGPAVEQPRDRLIALHARALTFLHPIRYEPITVEAPLPSLWDEVLTCSPRP